MSENRDRLGLWGTATVDSEVAGNISGLERLRLSRFNKVSAFNLSTFIRKLIYSAMHQVPIPILFVCDSKNAFKEINRSISKDSRLRQGR